VKKAQKDRIDRSIREYVSSPAIAYSYDTHYEDTALLRYDSVFLEEALPDSGSVLDIGCGTGRHVVEMASRGLRCTGLDLSPHMITLTRAKLERTGLSADLVQANMTEPLPFDDAAFDGVICMFSTIGLVPGSAGRAAVVEEIRRVVKPGGVFILHVHNRLHNLFSAWGRYWLFRTYVWDRMFTDLEVGDRIMPCYRGIENMYLHVFSERELRALLESGGFSVRRIAYLNPRRNGEITSGRLRSLRANGFLIAAEKTT
jgi:SAM-dependent methyltransferase